MKRILLQTEKRRKLLEKFDINNSTASTALNFRCRSKLSREIRSYAVNVLKGQYLCIE